MLSPVYTRTKMKRIQESISNSSSVTVATDRLAVRSDETLWFVAEPSLSSLVSLTILGDKSKVNSTLKILDK